MASILDRYGIKEVADVTFYELGSDGKPTKPVLYLDTLKVSTIEQTAEQAEARGGKGNPPLIIWDYGKEINVTLEDALFSAKSMAIMFGNGAVKNYSGNSAYIMRTEEFIATSDAAASAAGWVATYEGPDGATYSKINPKFYTAAGASVEDTATLSKGEKYFCSYDLLTQNAGVIIPKAKMNAENTITLEAEGDPSVFNMSLRVMRPADGVMMKLVKYDLANGTAASESSTATLIHNHTLEGAND